MKIIHTLLAAGLVASAQAHEGTHEHPKGVATHSVKTGNGKFTYMADAQWGTLKDGKKLGPTHGSVVIDTAGLIYVSSSSADSLFVFKADGTLVKTMAPEAKGMHHMTIREENGKQYIYGAQLSSAGGKRLHQLVKIDLEGNVLLKIPNDKTGEVKGGFGGVTGVAVAPNGEIFASHGYGSNLIHRFSVEGKLLQTFGGKGKELENFNTPHTIAIDTRFGEPRLLVSDREKRRLVHFDLKGKFIGVHATNLRRPCAVSFFGDYCAVAELESRVVILDKNGAPISFLGDNPNRKHWANFKVKPEEQKVGVFSAPHGLSFDKDGNLYVQDWNATGRATKLTLQK